MEEKQFEVLPYYHKMEQQVHDSEFIDIINSEKQVYQMTQKFEENKKEFQQLVNQTLDYELIFDKVDCRQKLEQYVKTQLAVKAHEYELIEVKDQAVYFYQPFENTKRRVAIESEELTEHPTLVNTKENGRLLITGGIKGYSSSN